MIQNWCVWKGEERERENYVGIRPSVSTKNVFLLPKSSVSSAMWWCKVMGWVGRHGWLVFGMRNPPVSLLPWLLMILARNISMGMCVFAISGSQTSKYKCCFINLQYNCSVAKSRVGSLPPTAFGREAKLLSMPYQPSSDGFISHHPPTSPPPLSSPHFSSTDHVSPMLHSHWTSCSPLGTLCSSRLLPFTHAVVR